MYQYVDSDEPRARYAALVRSREQGRLAWQGRRDGGPVRARLLQLLQRVLERRGGTRKVVGRVVGA